MHGAESLQATDVGQPNPTDVVTTIAASPGLSPLGFPQSYTRLGPTIWHEAQLSLVSNGSMQTMYLFATSWRKR